MRKLTKLLLPIFFVVGGVIFTPNKIAAAEYSGTLPVMYINTEDGVEIVSKEDYVSATAWLDNLGLEQFEAVGSEEEPLELQIRGRGNYTWRNFDKKPYRLKFASKQTFLGIPKSKHYALLAAAGDDMGFMRDPIGFYLSKLLGLPWSPEIRPVEVVLNGDYIGLYFLTETVRVDKNRVNIVEQADEATDPEEITGGWLVEKDNTLGDPHITLTEHDAANSPIIITYHTPEALSEPQLLYLTEQMNLINDAIYIEDVEDNTWENYVDVEALARYYIVQEVMNDVESFSGSCYFYKDLGTDTKWTFGPVWDFGNAFHGRKSMFIFECTTFHNTWIEAVYRHPHFVEVVKNIWQEVYPTLYEDLESFIDEFVASIRPASLTNYERWPQYGNNDMSTRRYLVLTHLNSSIEWLNEQWGEPEQPVDPTIEYNVYFTNDLNWEKVYAYAWFEDEDEQITELLGSWPGTLSTPNEEDLYAYSFMYNELPQQTHILFHNGDEAEKPAIDGFTFVNEGIYDSTGYLRSSIYDILNEDAAEIVVNGNTATISATSDVTVVISDILGRVQTIVCPGGSVQTLTLPSGIYFINGRKVFIR
ncbi:MAG: CotH kinase family protein [Muribaculaceae bacterium]